MVPTEKDENKKGLGIFPDGTTIFDFEDAEDIEKGLERRKLAVSDCILLLLYAQQDKPVFGRVLLMKEVFFLMKEVLNENDVQDVKFIKHHFGMYSYVVGNAVDNLEYSGFIKRQGKKNAKLEQFELTDKAKRHIAKAWNSLPNAMQHEAQEKRKGWDQLGYAGILRLAYRKYPEFREKSRLKGRYKTITWGTGIG